MKILVADDCLTTRRVLDRDLRQWGYTTCHAADGRQALEIALGDDPPQLILLDWVMPYCEGPEVCKQLRRADLSYYPYIIFLTSNRSPQATVDALAAGADDFLAKPVSGQELYQRIRAGQRIVELHAKWMASQAALRELARRDPLTGVLNRGGFMESLQELLVASSRTDSPLCLIMLDLDHFKQVNDTLGHIAGDQVLCQATARMAATLPANALLGRFGGEEFCIALPVCQLGEAKAIAEEVRFEMQRTPYVYDDQPLLVTASLGVAQAQLGSTSVEALLRVADRALYAAKAAGRNRVRLEALRPEMPVRSSWCPDVCETQA